MAAAAIMPELALSQTDAKELAEAVAGVNQFYSTQVDPKLLAWIGVITVAGKIYAPRLIAAGMRKRAERANRPKNVAPLKPVVNTPQSENKSSAIPKDVKNMFSDPTFISVPGDE